MILIIISLILTLKRHPCTSSTVPTRLLVTRVGPCFDEKLGVVNVSEMKLKAKAYDSTLNGALNISQDIENGWIVKARMQKCHDIRNQDTCDHFKQLTVIRSGCDDEEEDLADRDIVNMFLHYVHPKLECPLKAGTYNITDYPFFSDAADLTTVESKISTSVFGYSLRLEAFDADEDLRLMCVDAYIRMLYVREHDWVSGNEGYPPTKIETYRAIDRKK